MSSWLPPAASWLICSACSWPPASTWRPCASFQGPSRWSQPSHMLRRLPAACAPSSTAPASPAHSRAWGCWTRPATSCLCCSGRSRLAVPPRAACPIAPFTRSSYPWGVLLKHHGKARGLIRASACSIGMTLDGSAGSILSSAADLLVPGGLLVTPLRGRPGAADGGGAEGLTCCAGPSLPRRCGRATGSNVSAAPPPQPAGATPAGRWSPCIDACWGQPGAAAAGHGGRAPCTLCAVP